jgi:hypothetical protein
MGTKPKRSINLLSINCTPQQRDALRKVSARTLIPQQVLLRRALDKVISEHRRKKAKS